MEDVAPFEEDFFERITNVHWDAATVFPSGCDMTGDASGGDELSISISMFIYIKQEDLDQLDNNRGVVVYEWGLVGRAKDDDTNPAVPPGPSASWIEVNADRTVSFTFASKIFPPRKDRDKPDKPPPIKPPDPPPPGGGGGCYLITPALVGYDASREGFWISGVYFPSGAESAANTAAAWAAMGYDSGTTGMSSGGGAVPLPNYSKPLCSEDQAYWHITWEPGSYVPPSLIVAYGWPPESPSDTPPGPTGPTGPAGPPTPPGPTGPAEEPKDFNYFISSDSTGKIQGDRWNHIMVAAKFTEAVVTTDAGNNCEVKAAPVIIARVNGTLDTGNTKMELGNNRPQTVPAGSVLPQQAYVDGTRGNLRWVNPPKDPPPDDGSDPGGVTKASEDGTAPKILISSKHGVPVPAWDLGLAKTKVAYAALQVRMEFIDPTNKVEDFMVRGSKGPLLVKAKVTEERVGKAWLLCDKAPTRFITNKGSGGPTKFTVIGELETRPYPQTAPSGSMAPA